MHTSDIGLFSCFDLSVDSIDDLGLLVFSPWKVAKDAKTMNYAAGKKFDEASIMPFL